MTNNGVARMFLGMLAPVVEFERERILARCWPGAAVSRQSARPRQVHLVVRWPSSVSCTRCPTEPCERPGDVVQLRQLSGIQPVVPDVVHGNAEIGPSVKRTNLLSREVKTLLQVFKVVQLLLRNPGVRQNPNHSVKVGLERCARRERALLRRPLTTGKAVAFGRRLLW